MKRKIVKGITALLIFGGFGTMCLSAGYSDADGDFVKAAIVAVIGIVCMGVGVWLVNHLAE